MTPKTKTDHQFTGALIEIDATTGRITQLFVCCQDSDQADRITKTLERISRPSCWSWLRRLVSG